MALNFNTPVLVVEDDSTMLRIIRNFLRQLGFADVDGAGDASLAMDMLHEKDYGLVISDWNMAPMTGYDLLQHVRSDGDLCETPFVMVTGDGARENRLAAQAAGVNGYLLKPFNAATLKSNIEPLL